MISQWRFLVKCFLWVRDFLVQHSYLILIFGLPAVILLAHFVVEYLQKLFSNPCKTNDIFRVSLAMNKSAFGNLYGMTLRQLLKAHLVFQKCKISWQQLLLCWFLPFHKNKQKSFLGAAPGINCFDNVFYLFMRFNGKFSKRFSRFLSSPS